MTQQVPDLMDDVPEHGLDTLPQEIFEKKEKTLLNSDKFYIKKINNDGVLEDAYDGIFDFSLEDSKKDFDVLKKIINANNWYVISDSAVSQYNNKECSLEDLEKLTEITHSNLGVNFKEFPKKEIQNSFIDNSDDFQSVQKDSEPVKKPAEKPITKLKPTDVITSLDLTVRSKLNHLNLRKANVKKTNGVSLKSIAACAGVWAIGAVISPLSAITVPVAIGIGAFAVAKAFFIKNPEAKNYEKQINLLEKATKNVFDGGSTKITNENFKEILFDEKIESEFAKLCAKNNVQIDNSIFPDAYKYKNSDILEHNRTAKKNRLR